MAVALVGLSGSAMVRADNPPAAKPISENGVENGKQVECTGGYNGSGKTVEAAVSAAEKPVKAGKAADSAPVSTP